MPIQEKLCFCYNKKKEMKKDKEAIKIVCVNKSAYSDYEIEQTFEAGMVLEGSEVKALRNGSANLKDSYARIRDGELFLINSYIGPYIHSNRFNHQPDRVRKLLVHKKEIRKLAGKVQERGRTLIPLKIYFKNGKAKVEIAIAKGRKLFDKRRILKEKEQKIEAERAMKMRYRK